MIIIYRIYAHYDDEGIYVYQAFKKKVVEYAVENGTFGKGFGVDRITWIKPSYGWILARSNYGKKHRMDGIAKIKISHKNWLEILKNSISTIYDKSKYDYEYQWKIELDKSGIIHQWDPDKDVTGRKLERKAIQIGLRYDSIIKYVSDWIIKVEDVTDLTNELYNRIKNKEEYNDLVSDLKEYKLHDDILFS